MRNHVKRLILAGFILLLAAVYANAQTANFAADLASTNPNAVINVIVQYKNKSGLSQSLMAQALNAQLTTQLSLINGGVYTMTAGQAMLLASDPHVAYVSPDRPLRGTLDLSRSAVQADIAQSYGWNGTGIGVAVIDSGVSPVIDFGNRIVYATSFTAQNPIDDFGHGTHVSGIVAGNGQNSSGQYKGIAPKANIINLRVLDSNGAGTDSKVIAAINQAISLKSTYNIRVINLSLGRPVQESYTLDPLCQAVEQAWRAGIVVVVAAGNNGRDNSQGTYGYGAINSPGNDPYVITVGAMKSEGTPSRSDDLIASYSSKGPTLLDHIVKPDLVAPGNLVVSDGVKNGILEQQYPQNMVGSSYFKLSGTSMAAPMVSGAVALLLQQNPNLTPDQVKARLMKSAYKNFPIYSVATDPTTGMTYTSYYDIFTIGAGYLDIWAALHNSSLASGYALSPKVVHQSSTNSFTLAGTPGAGTNGPSVWTNQSLWDTQSIWDTRSVWGSAVLVNGTQSLWGTQSVWGSSANAVWSTQSIWDTSTPAGEGAIGAKGEK